MSPDLFARLYKKCLEEIPLTKTDFDQELIVPQNAQNDPDTVPCDIPMEKLSENQLRKKLNPWNKKQYDANIFLLKIDYLMHCRKWGKSRKLFYPDWVLKLNAWGHNKVESARKKTWVTDGEFEAYPIWTEMEGWFNAWIHIQGMRYSNPTGRLRTQEEIEAAHQGYL